MRTRRARLKDVEAIARLIEEYASQGMLLPRGADEIRVGINRFVVLLDGERVLGCAALESYGPDLAEIRSVAIAPSERGQGLGARLLRAAMAEAKRRGFGRVFAVTHAREFFLSQGFQPISRHAIREKIERDCAGCGRRTHCHLVAVVAQIAGRPPMLPVLAQEPTSSSIPGAARILT